MIVKELRIAEVVKDPSGNNLAGGTLTSSEGRKIMITIAEKELNNPQSEKLNNWKKGLFASYKKHETFVHEFGHALAHIHDIKFPFYKEIDGTIIDLESPNLEKTITTNKYKMGYCNDIKKYGIYCLSKVSPKINTTKVYDALISHSMTKDSNKNEKPGRKKHAILQLLEQFIIYKVKNLKIPGKNQEEKDKFIKSMLLKIFINSNYGRSYEDDGEVPSEGFAYWLLTDEKFRDKAWEIWNEFFLEYLPAWRSTSEYFKK